MDCICLVVSGSSNIFTMGSVSDCSCFSWATTSVLFSLRADKGRIKNMNQHVHDLCPSTINTLKQSNQFWMERVMQCSNPLWSSNISISLGFVCVIAGEVRSVYPPSTNTYYGEFPFQEKGFCEHPWRSPPCLCHWGGPVFHEAVPAHCRSKKQRQ